MMEDSREVAVKGLLERGRGQRPAGTGSHGRETRLPAGLPEQGAQAVYGAGDLAPARQAEPAHAC